jgi:hypothetical protein
VEVVTNRKLKKLLPGLGSGPIKVLARGRIG